MAFIDPARVKLNDELDSDFARRFTRQGDDFLDARFDNEYYVASTRHCYDRTSGYRTEFVAECAYMGGG